MKPVEVRGPLGVSKSGDQRFERLNENGSFFRFELIQGMSDLGFAQLAEIGADPL
jgi:hypothetical protein